MLLDPSVRQQSHFLRVAEPPVSEIGCRCDTDHPDDLARACKRRKQHDPPAHRRSDQHHRPCNQIDHRQRIVPPIGERLILERAVALTAPGIVEPERRAALFARPLLDRDGLGPAHVGRIAGQKHDGRAAAFGPAIGDARAVGAFEILDGTFLSS
jgi:hypothetical protein